MLHASCLSRAQHHAWNSEFLFLWFYSHCKEQFAEFAKPFVFHPLCSKTIYEHISTILAVMVWVYHPFWPKTTPYPVHLPF